MDIFGELQGAVILWVVLILTGADLILGFLNSLQNHSFKSSINKQGLLQKVGCIVAIAIMYVLDVVMGINSVGFSELFGATLCVSELVSILSNCKALGIPLPSNLNSLIEKYTNERK